MSEKESRSLLERIAPVLLLASIAMAFIVGVLWQKVSSLEKGITPSQNQANQANDTNPSVPTPKPVSLETIKGIFDKDVIKFGDGKTKLLFIEVADPSCPYCHVAAGLNPELNAQIGERFKLTRDGGSYIAPVAEMKKLVDQGKASFAWIYTPGHGNGEMGTKALYCAYEKGKFWEAHDLLMTNEGYDFLNNDVKNDKSKSQEVADFLKDAIDPEFLKNCLDSGKYDKRLQEDIALARSLNVTGTPGFYVNERLYPGAYNWIDMKASVDEALK